MLCRELEQELNSTKNEVVVQRDSFDSLQHEHHIMLKKFEVENEFLRKQLDEIYGTATKILANSKDFSLLSPQMVSETEASLIQYRQA